MQKCKLAFFALAFSMILFGSPLFATAAEKFISIGTAKIGGTWYPVGAGLAEIIGPSLPGTNISVEETAGADENARRVAEKDMEIGLTVAKTSMDAYNGEGKFQGKPKSVLAWFSLENRYQTTLSLKSSGINAAADIKGKRIGIGVQGSANFFDGEIWLRGHGIELKEVTPLYLGQAEMGDALKDRRIDVMLWTTGVPSASIQELCVAREISFIPTTKEAAAKISKDYPWYKAAILPAGSYQNMKEDYHTMLNNSLLILSPNLPEEDVYNMTKAVFSNLDKLGKIHPIFKEVTLDNAVSITPIPLHPGALRYFKEHNAKGVERFLK